MLTDEQRKEFSVRENWRGQMILMVRSFAVLSHSGVWRHADVSDLPQFFARMAKGSPKTPE